MSVETVVCDHPSDGVTLGDLETTARAQVRVNGRPDLVVARLTTKKAVRSGALWGLVFGLYVMLQALSYVSTYPTQASRDIVAKTISNGGGINAMMGPALNLGTVAGYTAWKCLGILSVLGAIWALLLSTRLLRGEEDAGRWELLAAGQTTRRRAAAQAMVGLGLSLAAAFALTAVLTMVVGRDSKISIGVGPAIYFALAIVAGAAVFMALGSLASQLASSRRQAAAYAGGALGVFYALRMVSDTSPGLTWLNWLTPFGWVDRLQPLTHPQPLVLIPIVLFTGTLAAAAVWVAGRRDLGAAILPDRGHAKAHTTLLRGPVGLAVRLVRPTVLGWLAGVTAFGLILGIEAKEAAQSLGASPSAKAALARLGGQGGEVGSYLGLSFLLLAVLVAFIATSQTSQARHEESSGCVEHLLVRPVSRGRWIGGRFAVAAVVIVVAGLLAGLSAWVGVAIGHAHMSMSSLIGAGLNVVPPALCLLGIGILALGFVPRLTNGVVYGVLAWSFLVELLGGIVSTNHWFLDTSLFHHMRPAPASPPDWTSGAALIALGIVAAALGTAALRRRDMAGE